jgi:protein O-mannosyl-transferase
MSINFKTNFSLPMEKTGWERYFSRRNLPFVLSFVLFLFTFLINQNSVPNDYAIDDPIYYTQNKFVQQGIKGIPGILTKSTFFGFNGQNDKIYRPLPLVCFAIEFACCGNNPHCNHFFNVILYALCCSLLFLVLHRLFNTSTPAIPFMIAVLFAAHPVHTEAVANIKGLDEILAFLFTLLAIHFSIMYFDRKKTVFMAASAVCCLFCMLSKEHGLALIAVIPLTLYTFRPIPFKQLAVMTLPYCGAALTYLVFRSFILDAFTFSKPMDLINNTLLATTNHADQFATAFLILGKYLRLLVIPYPLCWDYSYNQIPITTWADPRAIASFVTCLGLCVIGIIGMRKKSPIAYGILFFLLMFALSSNLFIKIGVTLGERLLFIPSLGYCIAVVLLFERTGLLHRRLLSAAVMLLIVTLYAAVTITRNLDWKDSKTLIAADLSKNTQSAKARCYWGNFVFEAGRVEKNTGKRTELIRQAVAEYKQSLAIYPASSDSWCKLGIALNELNEREKAMEAYQKAIALDSENRQANNNLGSLYVLQKELGKAEKCYRKAAEIDTGFAPACINIGAVNYLLKEYREALRWYGKAVKLNPKDNVSYRKMGELYIFLRDTVRAQQCFATASRLEQ